MESPTQKANELVELLLFILNNKKDLQPSAQEIITQSIGKAKEIRTSIGNIEKLVNLGNSSLGNEFKESMRLWSELKEGRTADKKVIDKIVSNSKSLTPLFRQGLDFISIDKFSESELRLSEDLMLMTNRDSIFFNKIRRAIREGRNIIPVRAGHSQKGEDQLNTLRKHKIISGYRMEEKANGKDNRWVSVDEKRKNELQRSYRCFNIDLQFIVDFTLPKPYYKTFIDGDWFTAYVYRIMFEYLIRNSSGFEIFTRVAYKTAPGNKDFAASDFDIIAASGKKIFLVECKSGFLKDGDYEVNDFIGKSKALKDIFKRGDQEFDVVFVYNPETVISETLVKELKDTSITPIKITGVRDLIAERHKNYKAPQ